MQNIYIDVFRGFSYDELLPMIKEIGFAGFFSSECYAKDLESLSKIKRTAERLGLMQETSHATIPGATSLWNEHPAGDDYVEVLKQNIDCCSRLQIPILVVHIQLNLKQTPSLEVGIRRLRSVVQYAKERNVKIAFENINSAEYLYQTLARFEDSHIGFCYDCGHEACHTPGEHFLPKIGHRLFCTHLHDNDTVSDLHLIPFDGQIDLERVARELKDCGYTGNLTLELAYNDRYRPYMSQFDFLNKSFEAAKKLKGLIAAQ